MRCFHITNQTPTSALASEPITWLALPTGQFLVVHDSCHRCLEGATRLPHLLGNDKMGDKADAFAQWGVRKQDTVAEAMLKVAPHWHPAWP